MKIIAFYLPQFHVIAENEKFWGGGFTEWVNVKQATPQFEGHRQPVEPLDDNYYDLLDPAVMAWQAELARKYGVYGFAFYHYWMEGRKLLEKPVESFLAHREIDAHFCLSWANHSWTRSWKGSNESIVDQTYGGVEDWDAHFDYLLPFFQDGRYIKVDNKPLFILYMPEDIPRLNQMLDHWTRRAQEAGFAGMAFAYQFTYFGMDKHKDDSRFDYGIEFQPAYAIADSRGRLMAGIRKHGYKLLVWLQKALGVSVELSPGLEVLSYERIWDYVLRRKPDSPKRLPGAFSGWDNTPRKGKGGLVLDGASPELFRRYLSRQIARTREVYHKDMLFLTAWNEWGEGCMLEPTKADDYGYLEAIREALRENGEFEPDSG